MYEWNKFHIWHSRLPIMDLLAIQTKKLNYPLSHFFQHKTYDKNLPVFLVSHTTTLHNVKMGGGSWSQIGSPNKGNQLHNKLSKFQTYLEIKEIKVHIHVD